MTSTSTDTLRRARVEMPRDLIGRVAGYSDYFCDLSRALQDEIIEHTELEVFERSGARRTPRANGVWA